MLSSQIELQISKEMKKTVFQLKGSVLDEDNVNSIKNLNITKETSINK